MIDRNSQFMAILTNVGAAKLANANALGIPWNLTELGVGDANDTDPMPNAAQTKLINERRRAPLNQLRVDPVNAAVIIAEQVIPADVGGWWIREIGLYDSDGDLVAVSNCAPSFKPALDQGSGRTQIVRMNFIVSSISNIVLKIDPAIVLATREYVDLAITEAINKQDFKHSVLVATTANIALNGIQTIDGVLLAADARVLVKDQAQVKDNGIYVVPASGPWKRAQDADASVEVTPGLFVSVEKGTANGDTVWQLVTDAPIVLGTTALTFEVVAGRTGVVAGTYRSLTVDKLGRVIAGTNPTTLAGAGITDAISSTPQPATAGAISDIQKTAFGTYASGTTDKPSSGGLFMRIKYPSDGLAIDFAGHAGTAGTQYFLRRTNVDNGVGPWDEIWHSGNFSPALKAPTANPTFTGTVTVPNVPAVANDWRAANTAFVQLAIANLIPRSGGSYSPKFSGISFDADVSGFNIPGAYIGWASSGSGAMQFVCNKGGGAGGFGWRSVNSDNSQTGPEMLYSYAGRLTVPMELYVPAIPSNTVVPTQANGYAGAYIANCAYVVNYVGSALASRVSSDGADVAGFATAGTEQPYLRKASNGAAVVLSRAMDALGNTQAWKDMTSVRAAATTYTNSTGAPIAISIYTTLVTNWSASITVSGVVVASNTTNNMTSGGVGTLTAIVPPGATYSLTLTFAGLNKWMELRA